MVSGRPRFAHLRKEPLWRPRIFYETNVHRLQAMSAVRRIAQLQEAEQVIGKHLVEGRPEQDAVVHKGRPLLQGLFDRFQIYEVAGSGPHHNQALPGTPHRLQQGPLQLGHTRQQLRGRPCQTLVLVGEQHLGRLPVDLAQRLGCPMLVVCWFSSQPLTMLGVTPERPPGVRSSNSSATSSSVQFRANRALRNADGSTSPLDGRRGMAEHLRLPRCAPEHSRHPS